MKHAVGTHRFSSCVVQPPPTSPGWVLIHQFSPLISWDAPFSCHCHSPSLMGVGHKHEKGQFWTHSPKYLRVEHGGSAVRCQHHGAPDEQFSGSQPFWCLLAQLLQCSLAEGSPVYWHQAHGEGGYLAQLPEALVWQQARETTQPIGPPNCTCVHAKSYGGVPWCV